MILRIFYLISLQVVLFSFPGCKNSTLFEEMESESTGIDFLNQITEDEHRNVMTYEYTYNGGGVAVGDLNNDGLTDIYLSGNSVPNKMFLNEGNWKFKEILKGEDIEGREGDWKTGITMADVNGDGWLDIYLSYSGNAPEEGFDKPVIRDYTPRSNQLFINNGSEEGGIPTFTERAKEYGLDAVGTFSTQAYFLDYDLDGDLDMFLLNHANKFYSALVNVKKLRTLRHPYFGNKLYRNEGQKFVEITEKTGIHGSGLNFGLSAAISDLNKDGWPDIYVTNDYVEQDFTYLNNGDGSFREISHTAFGHLSKSAMGSDIADINNDALPDIFVADMLPEDNYRQKMLKGPDKYNKFSVAVDSGYHHQYMRNTLQLNRGIGPDSLLRFSEIGQFSGISNTDWSWAPLFADYNNDGLKDLFITNGYLRDYTNLDFLNYTAHTTISNAKACNNPLDLLPLIRKMPSTKITNYAFKNVGGSQFENTTEDWGLNKKTISNAAAYADLDNDGDLDLVVNNLNEPVLVYKNNQEKLVENNYIKIRLKGEGCNTYGLGSKIHMTIAEGKELYHEAYYGRGYQSSVEPVLTIGIGEEDSVKGIEVIWPNGEVSFLDNIKANQAVVVDQSKAEGHKKQEIELGNYIFEDVTAESGLEFEHTENSYVDFFYERLRPYQMSRLGGRMIVGDINGDGNDDVYFGGAAGQSGGLYFGKDDGSLQKNIGKQPWHSEPDRLKEDITGIFFDADGDKDLDIYVVSGGNEKPDGSSFYQDRLYLNNGKGNFTKSVNGLPNTSFSGGVVVAADYDQDGDLDLFVGGRLAAQNYPFTPQSVLLRNDTKDGVIKFTKFKHEGIERVGMVTDAVWTDINKDSWMDLVLVGEWMPVTVFKNNRGNLVDITKELGLENTNGWWTTLLPGDFDSDGDVDFLLGNSGLNTQLKATPDQPMIYYVQDINNDGKFDPLLTYFIQGESYPIASRDELLGQVNSLRKVYKSYDKYARATIDDVLKAGNISSTSVLEIEELRSSFLENAGDGTFQIKPLPDMMQLSMINSFLYDDFNGDGSMEVLATGNFYPYRVSLGKQDASMGTFAKFSGNTFRILEDNTWLSGDIRDAKIMNFKNAIRLIVSRNDDAASLYQMLKKDL